MMSMIAMAASTSDMPRLIAQLPPTYDGEAPSLLASSRALCCAIYQKSSAALYIASAMSLPISIARDAHAVGA